MNANEIQLVKQTWSYTIVRSDEAGELFYTRLFEVAPDLRPLFKGDIKEQSRKLMSMVTYIVTKLDKLDTILAEIRSLARRHHRYGTQPEHYAVVGQCLIYMLKTGLRERWNKETENAWLAVYSVLAKAMMETQAESKSVL